MINRIIFKLGGYELKEVNFDRPYEFIANKKEKLEGSRLQMMDCLASYMIADGYRSDERINYAIFKNNIDTGIRFHWDCQNVGLASGKPLAFNYKTNQEYVTVYDREKKSNLRNFSASLLTTNKKYWTSFSTKPRLDYEIDIAGTVEEIYRLIFSRLLGDKYSEKFLGMNIDEIILYIEGLMNEVESDPLCSQYYYGYEEIWERIWVALDVGDLSYEKHKDKPFLAGVTKTEWLVKLHYLIEAMQLNEKKYYLNFALRKTKELTR